MSPTPDSPTEEGTLGARARSSPWVAEEDGLSEAVSTWEASVSKDREALHEEALELTKPGYVRPQRALRHLAVNSVTQWVRLGLNLPGDILSRAPLNDPGEWAKRNAATMFMDQLATGGAPAAEIARLIRDAGDLFPTSVTNELAERDVAAPRLAHREIHRVATSEFSHLYDVFHRPLAATSTSQLHTARTNDGRDVMVRVRRPGFARDLRDDARYSAIRMVLLERMFPQVGGMSPGTFMALTNRQLLEASDLRFEVLGLVELGLQAEAMGIDEISVARPIAHTPSPRAILLGHVAGTPLSLPGTMPGDPGAAVGALARMTIESAIATGVFWADLSEDHLVVDDSGRLQIVGAGVVGRLNPQMRRAGNRYLRALLTGDAEGQVEAMRLAGAIEAGADVGDLVADLSSSKTLAVSSIMSQGHSGLTNALNEAIQLLLVHKVTPPLEVVLLVRTIFSLGHISTKLLGDEGGMLMTLLPLLARLPELLAQDDD